MSPMSSMSPMSPSSPPRPLSLVSPVGTQPDLLYSEEEEALRAAVRGLLADHCDAAGVIARVESEAPHDRELWKALTAGMGLAGLLVVDDEALAHRSPPAARAPHTAKSPSFWRSWAVRSHPCRI